MPEWLKAVGLGLIVFLMIPVIAVCIGIVALLAAGEWLVRKARSLHHA